MRAPAPRAASSADVIDAVKVAIGTACLDAREAVSEVTITVPREELVTVMTALRDTPGLEYQQLMDIAGVDYPERPERFEVCYHLLSLTKNRRIRVKVSADDQRPVPSVTSLWPVAGWFEREVFDMFGVLFSGNADLRRILTDYGFEGHPFRKDFPLSGYVELRYSEEQKRVVYEPVKLPQEFRNFDFMSPWEGAEYILPGDEKGRLPEEKGAPTPASADAVSKAAAATTPATPPPPSSKDNPKPSELGVSGIPHSETPRPEDPAKARVVKDQ